MLSLLSLLQEENDDIPYIRVFSTNLLMTNILPQHHQPFNAFKCFNCFLVSLVLAIFLSVLVYYV